MPRGGAKPGERRGGRQKGTPNKLNAAVKDMILEALHELGCVEYLVTHGTANPKAFLSLVGRLVPIDMTANVAASVSKIELVAPDEPQ